MAFKSDMSKQQASSSINKLLGTVLPSAQPVSVSDDASASKKQQKQKQKQKQVAIQSLNETFYGMGDASRSAQELQKMRKKNRAAKKQSIRKHADSADKVEKAAKLAIIRNQIRAARAQQASKKDGRLQYDLTQEQKDLINGLIDTNVKAVQSWENSGEAEEELRGLQREILALKNAKGDARKQRQGKKRAREFSMEQKVDGKVSRRHAFPGLTPGLAPVGLEDSDDEDSD